jgi:anti-anti-sigma factor
MLKTSLHESARTLCAVCGRSIGRAAKRCVYCGSIPEPRVPQGRNVSRQSGVNPEAHSHGPSLYLKKGSFQLEVEDGFALVTAHVRELREPERATELVADILWLLEGQPVRVLIMDFSNVVALSSVFFGQLIQIRKAMDLRHVHMRMCGLAPAAREAIQICRLDKLIPVYDSLKDALKA